MNTDRNSQDYKDGYSHGKGLGSGLFRIAHVRNELARVNLLIQEAGSELDQKLNDYYVGVREALKTRENEIAKAWRRL